MRFSLSLPDTRAPPPAPSSKKKKKGKNLKYPDTFRNVDKHIRRLGRGVGGGNLTETITM